jgi:hypothetical protein
LHPQDLVVLRFLSNFGVLHIRREIMGSFKKDRGKAFSLTMAVTPTSWRRSRWTVLRDRNLSIT